MPRGTRYGSRGVPSASIARASIGRLASVGGMRQMVGMKGKAKGATEGQLPHLAEGGLQKLRALPTRPGVYIEPPKRNRAEREQDKAKLRHTKTRGKKQSGETVAENDYPWAPYFYGKFTPDQSEAEPAAAFLDISNQDWIHNEAQWNDTNLELLRRLDRKLYTEIMDKAAKVCKPAADFFGLSVEEAINVLRKASAETLARETTARASDDTRLGRLQARYERRLREIELPDGGFTTKAQVGAAHRLAQTFSHLQKVKSELGLPVTEKPEQVRKAEAMASAYRRSHDKSGAAIPVRRPGRPRREAQAIPPLA